MSVRGGRGWCAAVRVGVEKGAAAPLTTEQTRCKCCLRPTRSRTYGWILPPVRLSYAPPACGPMIRGFHRGPMHLSVWGFGRERPGSSRSSRNTAGCPSTSRALADDADLYQAGMTSHASVNLMLALEDGLRRRVPGRDAQAQRLRERRRRSREALADARARRRHEHRHRSRPGLPRRDPPHRRRGRGAQRRRRRPRRRASRSRRSTRCARSGRSRRSSPRSSAAAASRSRRSRARASSSDAAAARPRWSSRCTRSRSPAIVRHLDGAPWFEAYLRDVASEQRLIASVTSEVGTGGDLGRSIAAVTPGGDGTASRSRSRRRPSATAPTPTTCSRRCAARPTPSPATRWWC